jgi:hypothetical protein
MDELLDEIQTHTLCVTERQIRLFGCACLRAVWNLLESHSKSAVEVAERYAYGDATEVDLVDVRYACLLGARFPNDTDPACHVAEAALHVAAFDARSTDPANLGLVARRVLHATRQMSLVDWMACRRRHSHLTRCVLGDQMPRIDVDPTWLTPTVRSLAEAAYQERHLPGGELDTVRLAILADALEEAGAFGAILDHLRGPGPHALGCRAVEAVTGRA